MKIAILGASGTIGQRILSEALGRGHEVKALLRATKDFVIVHPQLKVDVVDLFDADSIADGTADVEVVINATGAGRSGVVDVQQFFVDSTRAIIEGIKRAGDKRVIVVGGAGSLEVEPGVQLVDTPQFPDVAKPTAKAQSETLDMYRASDIDWTFFSPSATIRPGRRTEKYRTGKDQLLRNEQGESYISAEDYAYALLNEVEHPQYRRQRFTAVSLER
jgi:putative NADH-flavin reductase